VPAWPDQVIEPPGLGLLGVRSPRSASRPGSRTSTTNCPASANNLADAYRAVGDLDRPIPLYELTLAAARWVLGEG